MNSPPRLVPDLPLPPYTYIPGRSPHPLSHPEGHRLGVGRPEPSPLLPERWQECRPYLYGIDLFHGGYYWEAHEVWEGLWHAAGRRGMSGRFLKALIKLAAAGVKVREGRPEGVLSHARRAAVLLREVAGELGGGDRQYAGMRLEELIHFADELATHPPAGDWPGSEPVAVLRPLFPSA